MASGGGVSRYSVAAEEEARRQADTEREAERRRLARAPLAARVALWLTVAIVGLTAVALFVVSQVEGDDYWGGFAVAYFGGPLILLSFLIALVAGAVGLVDSVRERSRAGVLMSVAPFLVLLFVVLVAVM